MFPFCSTLIYFINLNSPVEFVALLSVVAVSRLDAETSHRHRLQCSELFSTFISYFPIYVYKYIYGSECLFEIRIFVEYLSTNRVIIRHYQISYKLIINETYSRHDMTTYKVIKTMNIIKPERGNI